MFRTIVLLAVALGAMGLSAVPARAAVVEDLYEARVAVDSQSASDRNEGFRRALERVMIRISGSTAIGEQPQAQALLEQASRYVRQFRYVEREASESSSEAAGGGEPAKSFDIRVTFNGEALEQTLSRAGLPVWGVNRPSVLVLTAVQNRRRRSLLSENDQGDVKTLIQEAARARGVPLVFPVMDLEDRGQLDFADIRAGFSEVLLEAASRYNTVFVLSGFMESESGGRWSARWTVLREKASSRWNESGVSLETAVASGMNGLADILASRYAVTGTTGNRVQEAAVQVEAVDSFEAYAQVMSYLDSLVFVDKVVPLRIEPDRIVFQVSTRSEMRELERVLTLSEMLRPVSPEQPPRPALSAVTDPSAAPAKADLLYRYHRP